jgi:hypothetical protein
VDFGAAGQISGTKLAGGDLQWANGARWAKDGPVPPRPGPPPGPPGGPSFPRRFSADVQATGNFAQVEAVYQDLDLQRSLLAGQLTGDSGYGGWRQQTLLIAGPRGADPSTPYAKALTQMSWQSNHAPWAAHCSYELATKCVKSDPNSGGCVEQAPATVNPFFGNPVTVLEKKEPVGGVLCEKWSNGGTPAKTMYWAIWFAANSIGNPDGPTVLKAQVINPGTHGGFPTPGWTAGYSFSNFTTHPIPAKTFSPPLNWLHGCTNSDDGVIEAGVPGRQSGYLCVEPGKEATFTLGLKVKPEKPVVHVSVQYCSSSDYCIDGGPSSSKGGGCKDCVAISSGDAEGGRMEVAFTPENWNSSKTLTVKYLKSGDSQFKITSTDYFIKDSQTLQFSTCACRAGEKCSNECSRACGKG